MIRSTILILSLLVAGHTATQAQEAVRLDELEWRRGVYLERPSFEPYTGPVIAMWDAETVRERGRMVDGRWDGVREIFYQDGRLAVRETYRDGVLHGPFEAYFRTGSPSARGTYVDGELHGPYESFWLREPAERGTWAHGEECGEWMHYFPTSSYGLRVERIVEYPPCPLESN